MDLAGKNLLESKGKTYYEKFMSAKAQEKIVAITESPASEGIKKVFQNSADLMNEKDGDTVVKITCKCPCTKHLIFQFISGYWHLPTLLTCFNTAVR